MKTIHRKLHQKLLLQVGSLLLLCFAGFMGVVFYMSITTTKQTVMEKDLPLTAQKVVALVRQAAMKPALYAEASTNNEFMLDWLEGDMEDYEVMVRFLEEVEKEKGMFSAVVVSDKNKNVYAVEGILKNIAGRGPDYWYNKLKKNSEDMELIIAAPKYNGNTFSIFANQKLFNRHGKFVGVAGYGLELEETIEQIMALRSNEENRIFITDGDGNKIIYNNKDLSDDFVPNVLDEEGLKEYKSSLLTAQDQQIKYKRNGKTYLADVNYMPELGWYVFYEVNQEILLAPVYRQFTVIAVVGVLAVSLVLFFLYVVVRKTSKPINQLAGLAEEVKEGKVNTQIKIKADVQEVSRLTESFRSLTENLRNTSQFAHKIEQGKLDAPFQAASEHDELGKALLKMRDALQKVEKESQHRQWANEGLAKFSDLLRRTDDGLENICSRLISELVKYLNANQGAIFIAEEKDNEQVLVMKGCYAYGRKKYLNQTIYPGEGLVGQAWLEKDFIYMNDVPDDYIKITSGLGQALPTNVLIVPLKSHDEMLGIIELASFREFETHHREFIERLAEAIAASLAMINSGSLTQRLLEETQKQTEQLRAQEEEMRERLTELSESKQQMEEKEKEHLREIEKLKSQLNSEQEA